MLYPLRFKTIFKEKIWGGQKIKDVLNKDFSPLSNCGETWEVSGVNSEESIVSSGELEGKSLKQLLETYKSEIVGKHVYEKFGDEFPLLIKFIDANEDLSIQVHPDDKLGMERHNSFGKTEMWYVLQADDGASLISGFNKETNREEYIEHFDNGSLQELLNREQVNDGDVFFIPAGRVHTIGKGLLIAEIQQTSDITYRIYDFDRRDSEGNLRELHTEEALDAIDYKHYPSYKTEYSDDVNTPIDLCKSDYFITNKINVDSALKIDRSEVDSFIIYIGVKGQCTIKGEHIQEDISMGECILVPSSLVSELEITGNGSLLETFVP